MAAAKRKKGITLSSLRKDETFVEVYLEEGDDEPLGIWYRPSLFTLDMSDDVDEDGADGAFGVVVDMLSKLITRWDLYLSDEDLESGNPLPITSENMRHLPMHWLFGIRQAILTDYVPKYMTAVTRATPGANQNGTGPTETGT